MKKYISLLFIIGLLFACVVDDSSLVYPDDNPNFSKITITSPVEELSVDFGQTLNFTPEVSQTIENKTVTYKWEASYFNPAGFREALETIGEEKTLNHKFLQNGEYEIRLEVKNEDYSVFKTWRVLVRVYDEGFMVVGENAAGESNIAFARKLSETDILNGVELTFTTNLINTVNSDLDIKDVVFVGKSIYDFSSTTLAYLFILTKKMIYVADASTFKIINAIGIEEASPGASISEVSMMDTYTSGILIRTDNGKLFQFSKQEFVLYENENHSGTYEGMFPNLFTTVGSNQNIDHVYVDYSTSKIWSTIFYYAPHPVNNTSDSNPPFTDDVRPNEYAGRDIISVGRMNGDYYAGTNRNFFAVTTDKTNPLDVQLVEFEKSFSTGITTLNTTSYTASNPITLPNRQNLIANARFSAMYYYNNNNIYAWNPLNVAPNNHLPDTPAIVLDGSKEVTCMAISYDMQELYVGFYDNAATGELKGGLYIYKCSDIGLVPNLTPTQSFEGITTRPKQVLYKPRFWGQYNSFF